MRRHNFKKMKIWLNAMDLCKSAFSVTNEFPKSEIYGLRSQINRCVVSVPSNIAEGSSRSSKKEFSRFLEISLGSIYELQTQLMLSEYQKFISSEQMEGLELKNRRIAKNDFWFSEFFKIK